MSFSSINIQGNIISSETLDKIRSEEKFKHQTPEAFGLARSASLRDEIGLSWSILRIQWKAFKKRLETLPKGDTGTSLTRERFVIPLLQELGYEVNLQKAQQISGKSYAISHGASNLDNFPLHIMGYNDNLDKRREAGGPRLSPHALMQEYLNNTEHLFALISNGKQLRLLRDATRLVRMSYLEFDLERMFEEELYADFSILYRVLHASRMPKKMEDSSEAVIEYYHQESLASGTRIRERLSDAVEESIKRLANGFLAHSNNALLIEQFDENRLSAKDYYTHQLRLIYRILFVVVLEERKLIYPEELTEEQQRLRSIYYQYYSIERLRKLTENSAFIDADKYDLWESLKTTFMLFEREEFGAKLGIKPLGSGLFAPQALGNLKELKLNNGVLLDVLKRLTSFVNEQGQLVRVNYSDLDVEEFGSIYEGLLEYDPVVEKVGTHYQFSFVIGQDRSSSGSHYTPEELVKPLIKHSLDYIIEDKLKESNPEAALLSIRVCDVACGSGHILLSAARRIATELASLREGAEQPSPTYFRTALRDVIRNCIYGVDLNPLAVELCKVAMWLEAHNPNEPLNFLDHHIKCGNAIVGLAHHNELEKGIADEAFKTLPDDEKELASAFKKRNAQERKTSAQLTTFDVEKVDNELQDVQKAFDQFTSLPESTPEEIALKEKAYQDLTNSKKWFRLKNLADLQVAQFFIPKTTANKEKLTTHAQYMTYLKQGTQIFDRGASMAVAAEKRFFHWFLEFPEVFSRGGFDCILGNPPYLGGSFLSGYFGDTFLNYIKFYFSPAGGQTDLAAYFVRRINKLNNQNGFLSLITTNSICEGDTRENGLDIVVKNSLITHAFKSKKWPGKANVYISLLTIKKNKFFNHDLVLDGCVVENISPYFGELDFVKPNQLNENLNRIYKGNDFLGNGFFITSVQAEKWLNINPKYEEYLVKVLNGKDINSGWTDSKLKICINFKNIDISDLSDFPEAIVHLKETVKVERKKSKDKGANEKWWLHLRSRMEMNNKLSKIPECIVISQTTKYLSFVKVPSKYIFTKALCVIPSNDEKLFSVLESSIHNIWGHMFGSALANTLRYTNADCFETFPFPHKDIDLKNISNYSNLKHSLLQKDRIGLTELCNNFHDSSVLGDYVLLRDLFVIIDEEVLSSYGWSDIDLRHDFYEVDYLPENDRVRYTIHPDARKEVLKRLLLLNHERYEEEIKQGLHKKKDVEAFYQQKGKPVPEGIEFSDVKKKKDTAKGKKKRNDKLKHDGIRLQQNLFPDPDLFDTEPIHLRKVKKGSVVVLKASDGKEIKVAIGIKATNAQTMNVESSFAKALMGKEVGENVKFGNGFKVIEIE